jgi:hypothetical protein
MNESSATPMSAATRLLRVIVVVFSIGLLASIAATAILGIAALILMPGDGVLTRILNQSLLTALYVGLCTAATIVMWNQHGRRMIPVMILAIVAAGAALAQWSKLVWFRVDFDEEKIIVAMGAGFTAAAMLCVQGGAFVCLRTKSMALFVLKLVVSGASIAAAGTILTSKMSNDFGLWLNRTPMAESAIGLAVAIGVVGTMLVPAAILMHNRRGARAKETLGQRITVRLSCPICRDEQRLGTGPVRCGSCGTLLNIELEEPRCECGYLLYRLPGTTCPECGRDVSPEMRGGACASPSTGEGAEQAAQSSARE